MRLVEGVVVMAGLMSAARARVRTYPCGRLVDRRDLVPVVVEIGGRRHRSGLARHRRHAYRRREARPRGHEAGARAPMAGEGGEGAGEGREGHEGGGGGGGAHGVARSFGHPARSVGEQVRSALIKVRVRHKINSAGFRELPLRDGNKQQENQRGPRRPIDRLLAGGGVRLRFCDNGGVPERVASSTYPPLVRTRARDGMHTRCMHVKCCMRRMISCLSMHMLAPGSVRPAFFPHKTLRSYTHTYIYRRPPTRPTRAARNKGHAGVHLGV